MDKTNINKLDTDDIFKLADLYFDRRGIIVSHLHNSYNKFIEEDIPNYLTTGDHVFYETVVRDKVIKYKFKYEDIRFKSPTVENEKAPIFPMEARDNNGRYKGKVVARVSQYQEITDILSGEKEEKQIGHSEEDFAIANIPVMVRSKVCNLTLYKDRKDVECDYDMGGYFVVNGQEKVIISQDKMIENKPMILQRKESGTELYTAQVNSISYKPHGIKQVVNITLKKDNDITIKIPILQTEVSVFIFLRALGLESDKSIINCICYDDTNKDLIRVIQDGLSYAHGDRKTKSKIYTQQDAQDYLLTKVKSIKGGYDDEVKKLKNQERKVHLIELLNKTLLPHIEGDFMTKSFYLGYVIKRLIKAFLRGEYDDRDSYINKRVDVAGELLFELFKQYYKKMLKECEKQFSRNPRHEEPMIVINHLKPNTIELGMNSALSTGSWPRNRKGVAQVLKRISFMEFLVFLRRVDSQGGASSAKKMTAPRSYHPSSTSFLCPASTPEHAGVGLTKSLALIANITIMKSSQLYIIRSFLKKNIKDMRTILPSRRKEVTIVFLNGEWLGITEDNLELVKDLRKKKLDGTFEKTTSIVHDIVEREIRVYCDSGRLYTPFLKVENNIVNITRKDINETSINKLDKGKIHSWEELLHKYNNKIEYVDTEEVLYTMIATKSQDVEVERQRMLKSIEMVKDVKSNNTENRYGELTYTKYTHCILHPNLLLAEIPTNTPFCNSNGGPRNIYQYAQKRQAMGIYASNYRHRLDISYILYNTQTPLVMSRTAKYVYSNMLPSGENAMVAIMVYGGFNQEDSMVVNKAALDRGLFRSMSLRKEVSEVQKNQSSSMDDVFMRPDKNQVSGMKAGDYSKLNDKGFVPEETKVVNGDILISKLSPTQPVGNSTKVYKDNSTVYKSHAPGIVDKVYTNIYTLDGYEMIKMRIRSDRKPEIGDKFCLLPSALIMTNKGWVKCKDIDINKVLIATMDKEYKLKYVQAKEKYIFDYDSNIDGKLYSLESLEVHTICTPNHKNFIKKENSDCYELLEAKYCKGEKLRYKKDCINDMVNRDTITINEEEYDMNEYLKKMGKDIALKESDTLPSYIWELGMENCKTLINNIMGELDMFRSRNNNLVNEIQRLAFHSGYAVTIKTKLGEHSIQLIRNKLEPWINYMGREKNTNEGEIEYKGKVYCIEVPETNLFYYKETDTSPPLWTGNSSRHGQKGTIGIVMSQADMPFTRDGVSPDICINPNAIPSRMTNGHIIECIAGKVSSLEGKNADGTAFEEIDIEAIKESLEKLGYNRNGDEYLYNGMTGQKIKSMIFIGPTFYQRLKHLVIDKIHSRSIGPKVLLTRQPSEGRSRDGGLRLGEMERDSIISHGMSRFLKEKFLDSSDIYSTYVCDTCGLFAQRLYKNGTRRSHITSADTFYCPGCKNYTNTSKIVIPYAFKLLIQELMTINIAPRIRTK